MVDVFWGCTTRFLMDLVGNPKADRFSRGVATALKITQCTSVCSFLTFVTEISSRFSLKYLQDLVSSILLNSNGAFTVNVPLFKVCSPFKNTQCLDVCMFFFI